MSRLYDRLMKSGSVDPDTGEPYAFGAVTEMATTIGGMPECVVVDASNVGAYWIEQHGADLAGDSAYPNIAPPFEHFFVEYRFDIGNMPSNPIRDWLTRKPKGHAGPTGLLPDRVGVLGLGFDFLKEEERKDPVPLMMLGEGWEDDHLDAVRFVLSLNVFWEYGKGRIRGPMYTFTFPLHSDGTIVRHPNGVLGAATRSAMSRPGDSLEDREFMAYIGQWSLNPALLALSFFHCKNVVKVAHDAPEKVQRKHVKRYGSPLTRYYTLEIEPMKATLEREGGVSKGGLKKALHITRGHFATYSPDKPLFGRYSGTFWKPQHVRGSRNNGEIVKDYAVKGPT